jgi:cell division protein FtsQ
VARDNRRKVDRVPGTRRRRVARFLALVLPTALSLAALVAGSAGAWRVAISGPALRIGAIRFEGLSRIGERELLELSPVRTGDHLLLSDLDRMEGALSRHPWVESVEVRRTLPPGLVVTVAERRAAALVELSGLYLVDARGRVFKRAAPGDGIDLPVVTGIARDDYVDRRDEVKPLLAAALALLTEWARRGLDRRMSVSEIHVDPDFGTTLYVGEGGSEIRLGTGALPEKLSRLARVLDALEADGREAEVVHLDNRRRPDWVAVRFGEEAWRGGGAGGRPAAGGRGPRGP